MGSGEARPFRFLVRSRLCSRLPWPQQNDCIVGIAGLTFALLAAFRVTPASVERAGATAVPPAAPPARPPLPLTGDDAPLLVAELVPPAAE